MKVLSPLKGRDDEEDDESTSDQCTCGWEVGHSWTCPAGGNQP